MPPDFAMKSEPEMKNKLKQEIKPKKSLMMKKSDFAKKSTKRIRTAFYYLFPYEDAGMR